MEDFVCKEHLIKAYNHINGRKVHLHLIALVTTYTNFI